MKKLLIPIAVCAISLTMISAGFAGLFGGKSIEGEIQDISANTLTIQEDKAADQAADQAAEEMAAPVSVEVNQDTQFEQVDSLAGLVQGDRVKVEYEEDQNRNLATSISKIVEEGQPEADVQQEQAPADATTAPAQY